MNKIRLFACSVLASIGLAGCGTSPDANMDIEIWVLNETAVPANIQYRTGPDDHNETSTINAFDRNTYKAADGISVQVSGTWVKLQTSCGMWCEADIDSTILGLK